MVLRREAVWVLIFFTQLLVAQTKISQTTIQELNKNTNDVIPCIALVNNDFSASSLKQINISVGSQIGDVVTLRIPKHYIHLLGSIKGIEYLTLAKKVKRNLSKVIPDLRADSVHKGSQLIQSYTGKNVLIGITDWGFDYTHPMFYDTLLEQTRIAAAWDQYKNSGPAPLGFNYGTEYTSESDLFEAMSDTVNIYGNATHGSHVAGIAGGSGAGTEHRGVAFEAQFLMATFLVDEAAVLDAFAWMKQKADDANKRLVINMSWGLYNIGTMDGTSLVSQAINSYSNQGVVFVTSGGNNGDVDFHIKKNFSDDTLNTRINFYDYNAHPKMWGQSISIWGEANNEFGIQLMIFDQNKNLIFKSPNYLTALTQGYLDTFILYETDTIHYNLTTEKTHPLNDRPHMRLRIKNKNPKLYPALRSFAKSGVVHYWNVVELTNDVGNWGMPFSNFLPEWTAGDNKYGVGEPACTESVITVAAHSSEIILSNGNVVGGFHSIFSSIGPTIDERLKPDISAPGQNVASSVSSFTDNNYTLLQNVSFKGKDYPFARFSGTSMSAPAVTGVVALMLEANKHLSSEDIKEIIKNTSREDKNTGIIPITGSTTWGWGKINAFAAVKEAERRFVSVNDLVAIDKFCIYPNPTNNKIYLELNDRKVISYQIYSGIGELVLFSQNYNNGIDVSQLETGVYLIRINDQYQSKFVVVD